LKQKTLNFYERYLDIPSMVMLIAIRFIMALKYLTWQNIRINVTNICYVWY